MQARCGQLREAGQLPHRTRRHSCSSWGPVQDRFVGTRYIYSNILQLICPVLSYLCSPAAAAAGCQTCRMDARAGQKAEPSDLIDVHELVKAYYDLVPNVSRPEQMVVFGTSGHRGSSFDAAFNETHIAAITQAIVEYRAGQGITGPLFIGKDTHGLSRPAETTALEVLEANGVRVLVDEFDDYVPTPALSHAIIKYNVTAA